MKKSLIIALLAFFAVPAVLPAAKWRPTPQYNVGSKMSQELLELYAAKAHMTGQELEEDFQIVGAQIASLRDFIAGKEAQPGASQQEITQLKAQLKALEIYHQNFRAEQEVRPVRMN